MEVAHENLLECFEEFELDLEVEEILKKVKADLAVFGNEEDLREFSESLKQLEPEKVEAQKRRAEQARPYHQLCYPQMTCDWFIEGLDYCCDYWRYEFKRPQTPPPPAPPPSPDVPQENCASSEPPTRAKKALPRPSRHPSERPKEPGGRKLTGATSHRIAPCSRRCRPKESCAPAEPPSSTTKAMMTAPNGEPRGRRPTGATRQRLEPRGRSTKSVTGQSTQSAYWRSTSVTEKNIESA